MSSAPSITSMEVAVAYAEKGWRVIPNCRPGPDGSCLFGRHHKKPKLCGKTPLLGDCWQDKASSNTSIVTGWFRQWNGANIGILLENVLVVDPDTNEAQEEAWKLGLDGGLARYSRQKAYLFRRPSGCPIHNVIHWGQSGAIDILTNGQLIVYGTHGKGVPVFVEDPNGVLAPTTSDLYQAPDWAVEAVVKAEASTIVIDNIDHKGFPPVRLDDDSMEWWTGEQAVRNGDGDIDRSETLWTVGKKLFEAGANPQIIAEALRERDGTLGYDKYVDRKDDSEYWRIAQKVAPSTNERTPFDAQDTVRDFDDWPEALPAEALYGIAGEIVEAIDPHSEADPAAILTNVLVKAGNSLGAGPHAMAEGARHGTKINAVIVGVTSKARKGSADSRTAELFERVDPKWATENIEPGGLSSGEGLIWAVRDAITKMVRQKDGTYKEEVIDEGVADKRLLVIEEEFASTLKVMSREGNTLSPLIRRAWDKGNLNSLVKHNTTRATGAHISIIGHITKDELLRYLTDTELGNGFANRFLWIMAKRSKMLPHGGGDISWGNLVPRLREVLEKGKVMGRLERDGEANEAWEDVYGELSEGKPGLFGAVTARAEAQVLRLSVLYAVLDGSDVIRLPHLEAALAVWEYSEQSARCVFGDATGDPLADTIYRDLKASKPVGRTRSQLHALLGRHHKAARIDQALGLLLRARKARSEIQNTDGRPVELWYDI